jgi:predicted transcriptional regulator
MNKSNVDNENNVSVPDGDDSDNLNAEIEGISAGLEDIKAGRVFSHDEVIERIAAKLNNWKQ